MTARELYNNALIEINKLEAPPLLLEDYNYLLNKAVQQYVNKVYNRYEIGQQSTDDLRWLQRSIEIKAETKTPVDEDVLKNGAFIRMDNNIVRHYIFRLPNDYMHLLNCIAKFQIPVKITHCNGQESKEFVIGCKKATSDQFPALLSNYYMRPSYDNPYWMINRDSSFNDTELVVVDDPESEGQTQKSVEYTNAAPVMLEIITSTEEEADIESIYITYLHNPEPIILSEDDYGWDDTLFEEEDKSAVLEFPDYVCYEVINEFVKLLLENASDQRLQSNMAVNQTVQPIIPGAS